VRQQEGSKTSTAQPSLAAPTDAAAAADNSKGPEEPKQQESKSKSPQPSSSSSPPPIAFPRRVRSHKRAGPLSGKRVSGPRLASLTSLVLGVHRARDALEELAHEREVRLYLQNNPHFNKTHLHGGDGQNGGSSRNNGGNNQQIFFPSMHGGLRPSSLESYGPFHNSEIQFFQDVLFTPQGAQAASEKDGNGKGGAPVGRKKLEHLKRGGSCKMPLLCSDMLYRKEVNGYGYGCPLMVDPAEKLPHKIKYKIKRSEMIKPNVFAQILRARDQAIQRAEEKKKEKLEGKEGAPKLSREELEKLELERDKQTIKHMQKEQQDCMSKLDTVQQSIKESGQKKAKLLQTVTQLESELRELNMKRRGLVVQLKHIASSHQSAAVTPSHPPQLSNGLGGSRGSLDLHPLLSASASPRKRDRWGSQQQGNSMGDAMEEGEVLSDQQHHGRRGKAASSAWGPPLPYHRHRQHQHGSGKKGASKYPAMSSHLQQQHNIRLSP